MELENLSRTVQSILVMSSHFSDSVILVISGNSLLRNESIIKGFNCSLMLLMSGEKIESKFSCIRLFTAAKGQQCA